MDNDYEKFDTDPADCNGYRTLPEEFNIESSEEFTAIPDEYGKQDGQNTDISDLYVTENDNAEAAEDFDTDGYDTSDDASDYDEEYSEDSFVDPDDETAATRDDWNSNDAWNGDKVWDSESARARCSLDDYEIISDVLGSEKQLVKLYSTALCESAEESLRDVIKDNLIECASDQYSAYEYMQKRGLYQTEQASEAKISEAKSSFGPLCECNGEYYDNCGCSDCECGEDSSCGCTRTNDCNCDDCDC